MSLLEIRDLTIHYETDDAVVKAVNGISLDVEEGETLGLVGETGAGKTTTALGIMRLVPDPPGVIKSGSIRYEGRELLQLHKKEMQRIRGAQISMIFQDPMTALNPTKTIVSQIEEVVKLHQKCTHVQARARALEILEKVGINAERVNEYPHQFSGGMKQRVAIARTLANEPEVLLMDEPFGALDAQTRVVMQELLADISRKTRTTILFITHDIDEAVLLGDRIYVMSRRPGTIRDVLTVDLPAARTHDCLVLPEFLSVKKKIMDMLWQESQDAAMDR